MPKSYNIEYFKTIAIKKNGKCLSSVYKTLNTKLKWQCSKGHTWESIPNSIMRGTWCPVCAGKAKKTIQDMQELAYARGGKCLSKNYINGKTKLIWECANGHIWKAKYDNIQQGKWCPDCSTGLSERICRTYFEEVFKVPFPNTKGISWLRNDKGNFLELDGYSNTLQLAFEHQGTQHYEGESYFEKAKYDDIKAQLCEENNVLLIQIPQLGVLLPHSKLHRFLEEEFKNTRFKRYKLPQLKDVDLSKAYSNRVDMEMKRLAEDKGGEFLSKHYLGSTIKHQWKCANGHVWSTTPSAISSGNWCPKCGIIDSSEKRKADFDEILSVIHDKGGKCLSSEYINSKTKLKIECHEGHTWEALQASLKRGHWCPACAGQEKLKINDLKSIAESRGGICLSKKYVNANELMLWRCKKGHEWQAPAGRIKSGTWCLKCSGSGKLSLSVFQEIASERDGKCLSTTYKNANSKLEWECSEGHKWTARANHVKRGSWCPTCRMVDGTKKRSLSIDDMKQLAKQFNGKCLSINYVNTKSKLIWECDKGHRFEKNPAEVKKGRWCPNCKKHNLKK
ncbi:MAG: hypothetical protein L7V85_05170 [Bacteroidia bacterium]|nr:hypothetical protein [Bacteroidia bacterium]